MSVAGPSPTPRPLPALPVLRLELHSRRSWPSALASLFAHAALIAGVLVQGRAALRRGAVPGGGGGGGAGGDRPVINFFPMPARAAPAAVDVPPAPRVSVTALPAPQPIKLEPPIAEAAYSREFQRRMLAYQFYPARTRDGRNVASVVTVRLRIGN